ncbi:formylglycine-generating enzyme family protein [Cytophaga sp. FL35]|uniref:formylglycine-generating enzyme family protein n=1 Tax=Cytophaga sp. FL35 TaxID=1904456 RepID=UPI00165399EE|nr:formylglycine-generating enzyme family protein [Cytophaga sp. FL35]MBC6996937.1 formylglycine-generating enzyme family protein [Cytophaga sp. FL35]
MKVLFRLATAFVVVLLFVQCKDNPKNKITEKKVVAERNAVEPVQVDTSVIKKRPEDIETPPGMVWISGEVFKQGAVPQDQMAMGHEKPAHKVAVDGFFIDATEVTNNAFKKFVDETGYVTVAEREIDWEEMKKQLPEGTPRPHDSIMQPGSLTFKKAKSTVANLYDFSQWWKWTIGANWRHPNGPESDIKGKGNYPVVHIAYEDALAYCEWANRRLPTEAEWELAARGNHKNTTYFWGDEDKSLDEQANTWEGEFPVINTKADGYEDRAPVKSYPPNDNGLYDMAGNVWEWTQDWYNTNYYQEIKNQGVVPKNPQGAASAYNERDPYAREKVMKGGSFLCNASYCASYRISSRMATSLDSSLEHLGFRTVASAEMIKNQ